ncbi:MAG: S8 family serine peptidase, partial [Nitrospiraceae bacterium]
MFSVRYGGKSGKRYQLAASDELVVVRTHSRNALMEDRPYEVTPVSRTARNVLDEFELVARFREAGVEILRSRGPRRGRSVRDKARAVLKQEPEVRFAGRVLCDPTSKRPVVYTENFFVKFENDEKPSACRKILNRHGLSIKRAVEYARNAYFVAAPENTGVEVFTLAEKLLHESAVELCHPELVREARRRAVFAPQWHLRKATIDGQTIDAHAGVEAAWALSEGAGTTIAIIDDGVDLEHEEFRSPGKIVTPRDVTRRSDDPRPGNGDNHGTACAGVACADG